MNTTDPTPNILQGIVTTRTIFGFTVNLAGVVDTANYKMFWRAYKFPTNAFDRNGTLDLTTGVTSAPVTFSTPMAGVADYAVEMTFLNTTDASPNILAGIATARTLTGAEFTLAGAAATANYDMFWETYKFCPATAKIGITSIPAATLVVPVVFPVPYGGAADYGVMMSFLNTVDATPDVLLGIITDRTLAGMEITMAGVTDTANYSLCWEVYK
jgi:hypothetical protein